ncbi:MAG: nicotinate (nicotinamide) nucleotide adenylyltransferase [Deltaproteobacteria bacterium]|nr:nicotinate (nicotinamide) nucleotide adenylyltransferase [Deltaproteobacteria bacterium]
MRIGLFGGSFDPIHRGHVEPVQEARRQLDLDRVLFLPTAQPPHKPGQSFAPALTRFAMVELALLEEEGCFTCDHELTLGLRAYTVETIEFFRKAQPEDEFFLLIGMDSLATLHTWKRWQEIGELVEIIVLARPGWRVDDLPSGTPPQLRELAMSNRVRRVENRLVDTSSTELRGLLARGQMPVGYFSDLVQRYISKYALYR